MDWDDFKFILAVNRGKSFNSASKLLNLTQTTVSRRMKQIETQYNEPLFEQSKVGLVPTEKCLSLIRVAESAERDLFDFCREELGRDSSLSGEVSMTALDFLASTWASDLKDFSKKYPEIDLRLTTSYKLLNMSKREADICIRLLKGKPPEHLVGKKICTASFAFYAKKGTKLSKNRSRWISYEDRVHGPILDKLILRIDESAEIDFRVTSPIVSSSLLEEGGYITILPCILGDSNNKLERVSPLIPDYKVDLWVLTHPEIQKVARIRAFLEFIYDVIERDKDLISGQVNK